MIKFIVLFLLFGQVTLGQQNLTLNKSQMYADFDTLVNTIYQTSPQVQVKKDVLNYDFIKETNLLRRQIDTISNDLSFYRLLLGVLNSSQDLHTSALNEQIGWAEKQDNDYWTWRNSKFKFTIPLTYGNGNYYITSPVIIKNDTIPIGTVMNKFNGKDIDNYVNQKTWTRNGFSIDFNNKKFYNDNFYKNLESIFKDSLIISFTLPQGTKKEFHLPSLYQPKYLPIKKYVDTTRVEYWESERILYIRLTEMSEKYKDYLKIKLNDVKSEINKIDKIIVDIRNNPGGNDNVWTDLYADLIDLPITYKLKMAVTEQISLRTEFISKREKNNDKIIKKYNFYNISNEIESIEPSNLSIHFKGKIFVLSENVYSSAGSAVAVASANNNDNLISVGRYTGQFLGIGIPPLKFELANSKLKFRVAPSIEITNVKKAKDLMQDKIEVIVPFDLSYYIAKFESKILPTDKNFLIKFDPFIKAVIEQ
ncbi:MAG: S41 family peptidase [Bacteroidota bacterium]|jgi:hypothetical protein